jgi:Fe-S-cluster containining protein
MHLVTDPIEVERLAEKAQAENWEFGNWIKLNFGLDDKRLMSVVRRLTEEVTAQVDCTACANCCRVTTTSLAPEDMKRLASALHVDVPTLQQTYLEQGEWGKWELPAPCPLLDGNLCRVYDARPSSCREYPHLHNDFRAASIARINNTFICPIVFNVVEGMKVELDWPGSGEPDWPY